MDPGFAKTAREEAWFSLPWDAVVIHYQEIALKGGNRGRFLKRLRSNLQKVLSPLEVEVRNLKDRLLVPALAPHLAPHLAWQQARPPVEFRR